MKSNNLKPPENVDEYIADFPESIQLRLEKIREIVLKSIPAVEEKIAYGIPSYALKQNLIHFAGYKNHIGIYPIPKGDETFIKEMIPYRSGKSTAQFPNDKALPLKLIKQFVIFRLNEHLVKQKSKKK